MKIKVIDLLNKIANDEEVPKRIRIDHWCYKFEWVEHLENYYDKDSDIDLMSALSMNKEELNYEVEIIEEPKKIEKIARCDSIKMTHYGELYKPTENEEILRIKSMN